MAGSDEDHDVPHGLQSFAITCWQDIYRKLLFEIDEFELRCATDRGSNERGFRAVNVAWTAWHIHDWFFEGRMWGGDEHLLIVSPAFPNESFAQKDRRQRQMAFGKALTSKYWPLRVCRTIATACKHARADSQPEYRLITQPVRPLVIGTTINYEDVRIQFEGDSHDARDVFRRALDCWHDFFDTIGYDYPRPEALLLYILRDNN